MKNSLHHSDLSLLAVKHKQLHIGLKIGNHWGRVSEMRRMRPAAGTWQQSREAGMSLKWGDQEGLGRLPGPRLSLQFHSVCG